MEEGDHRAVMAADADADVHASANLHTQAAFNCLRVGCYFFYISKHIAQQKRTTKQPLFFFPFPFLAFGQAKSLSSIFFF